MSMCDLDLTYFSGNISKTVRCSKVILVRDIGSLVCGCATSWCHLLFDFDFHVVTFSASAIRQSTDSSLMHHQHVNSS